MRVCTKFHKVCCTLPVSRFYFLTIRLGLACTFFSVIVFFGFFYSLLTFARITNVMLLILCYKAKVNTLHSTTGWLTQQPIKTHGGIYSVIFLCSPSCIDQRILCLYNVKLWDRMLKVCVYFYFIKEKEVVREKSDIFQCFTSSLGG